MHTSIGTARTACVTSVCAWVLMTQIRKIGERDAALRTEHHALKVSTHDENDADSLDVRRKRLVYRSKQRGWLEVDLLLGSWAADNAHRLSHADRKSTRLNSSH